MMHPLIQTILSAHGAPEPLCEHEYAYEREDRWWHCERCGEPATREWMEDMARHIEENENGHGGLFS